jgi:DeoR/GlpR family transcriptional regulator of sugar metabolism
MNKLTRDERLSYLRELLEDKNTISTSELATEMDVSRMTLFRDLETLQAEGFIERFHGSVTLARSNYDLDASLGAKVLEKKAIAYKAIQLLKDDDVIFLGSGTSALEMAKVIDKENLQITLLTNSLPIVFSLHQSSRIRLIVAGGNYHQDTRSMTGPLTTRMIDGLSVRGLFFGANGVDLNGGLTAQFANHADLLSRIKETCQVSVALVDSSKFNKVYAHRICSIHESDYIITDSNLDNSIKSKFVEAGAPLLISQVDELSVF